MTETHFRIGDPVSKLKGYKFDGVVIMSGRTLAGLLRYVVDNGDGLLHVFAPEQLQLNVKDVEKDA